MAWSFQLVTLILSLLGFAIFAIYTKYQKRTAVPLPPGPRPLPVIGNLLDLPKEHDWLHWAKHKELYGPISTVSVLGRRLVILNDFSLATDILNKRSSIYADRPVFTFSCKMIGWEHGTVAMRYGPRHREYRKKANRVMGNRLAISKFYALQEAETRKLLFKVAKSGDAVLSTAIRAMVGAIILRISHGYRINQLRTDPLVELADKVVEQFLESLRPGAWLVDVFPILRFVPDWFPGTGFKQTAKQWKRNAEESVEKPYAFVQQQMAKGNAESSYTSSFLEDLKRDEELGTLSNEAILEEESIIKWSGGSLYLAGADTTVAAIQTFYLAMILHPEVLKKAQAEIDAVVGPNRLPTFDDRPLLPYIEAVQKEVLRWRPIAPMGIPHSSIQDDIVNGYLIPKGSIVMANIWQFTRDPNHYHDPTSFKPDRYLPGGSGKDGIPELDPHEVVFGFGRRVCLGKDLADSSLFIAIAMSVAVFDIKKATDPRTGVEIDPLCEYTGGFISHPKDFRCDITPRSKLAEQLVQSVEEDYPLAVSDADEMSSIKWE